MPEATSEADARAALESVKQYCCLTAARREKALEVFFDGGSGQFAGIPPHLEEEIAAGNDVMRHLVLQTVAASFVKHVGLGDAEDEGDAGSEEDEETEEAKRPQASAAVTCPVQPGSSGGGGWTVELEVRPSRRPAQRSCCPHLPPHTLLRGPRADDPAGPCWMYWTVAARAGR